MAGVAPLGLARHRRPSPARLAGIALVGLLGACSTLERPRAIEPAPPGQSTLSGWQHCSDDDCGKNLISAYTALRFVGVDGERVAPASRVTLSPGWHWIEAHYAWGVGVVAGVGNYRNYGFEFDVVADHRYAIRDVPSGCMVPASKSWVSPKRLRVEDRAPSGDVVVHDVPAMEYCTPGSGEHGSCRQDSDCRSGPCTPFGGRTGFGLCGMRR